MYILHKKKKRIAFNEQYNGTKAQAVATYFSSIFYVSLPNPTYYMMYTQYYFRSLFEYKLMRF